MNNINDNYNSISQKDVTIDYVVKKNDNGNNLVAALFYLFFFLSLKAIFLKTVFVLLSVGQLLSVVVHWTE